MSYQPNPVDTSQIDIGHLDSLTERLAENTHDVWARGRMKEGWTYGPVRDDKLKQHPGLKPYTALTDSEQQFDRDTSIEAVKFIVHCGYEIQPGEAAVRAPEGQGPERFEPDDMKDESELDWLVTHHGEAGRKLASKLKFLGEKLYQPYCAADEAAAKQQTRYLWASGCSVGCAAIAVGIAIFQLTESPETIWVPLFEFFFVVLSVVLVIIAEVWGNWRDAWLASRSRAERFRTLKFRTLLDESLWSNTKQLEARTKLESEVAEIESIEAENLVGHLSDAKLIPASPDRLTGDDELDYVVASYYLRRRLAAQAAYTKKKADDFHKRDRRTKPFGTWAFYLVLFFVFAHVLIDHFWDKPAAQAEQSATAQTEKKKDEHASWPYSRYLIAGAAILPAFAAALRVYRDGREYGLNHLRYEALHKRLDSLRVSLQRSQTRKEQLRLMTQAEVLLASEHEQWLQLMKECEWFG